MTVPLCMGRAGAATGHSADAGPSPALRAAPEVAALKPPVTPRAGRSPALPVAGIGDAPSSSDRCLHLVLAADAFAGRTALPQIFTPQVRIPD